MRVVCALLLVILIVLPVASQTSSVSSQHPPYAGVREWVDGSHIPPIKNAPFTAKVLIETSHTLADGTQIARKTMNLIARDSAGRTRNEGREMLSASDAKEPRLLHANVLDPVAKTRTLIFPQQHMARVFRNVAIFVPPAGPNVSPFGSRAAPGRPPVRPTNMPNRPAVPDVQKQDLGTTVMEGLSLTGTLETRTIAPERIGNDRPIVITDEFWYSPELQVNVLVKRKDPRNGTQTVRLTEVSREEPDEALFQVPAGYQQEEGTTAIPSGTPATTPGSHITMPRKIAGSEPSYTDAARRDKVSGNVLLDVYIGEDGSVRNVSVFRSLRPDLDESAVEAVRQWVFEPAIREGKPVATSVKIEVNFRIY